MLTFLLLLSTITTSSINPEIKLNRQQCAEIVTTYKPDPSINYQPGMDVTGEKVVPADLNSPNYHLGEDVNINIQSYLEPLIPQFSPNVPAGNTDYVKPVLEGSQAQLGTIHIQKDGKVFINGIQVSDEENEKIQTRCRKQFPDL